MNLWKEVFKRSSVQDLGAEKGYTIHDYFLLVCDYLKVTVAVLIYGKLEKNRVVLLQKNVSFRLVSFILVSFA